MAMALRHRESGKDRVIAERLSEEGLASRWEAARFLLLVFLLIGQAVPVSQPNGLQPGSPFQSVRRYRCWLQFRRLSREKVSIPQGVFELD